MRLALALRHVEFEDLGSFEHVLIKQGYAVEYVDAVTDDLHAVGILEADLLVVLGGPVGVYEQVEYPFLAAELDLIRQRLEQQKRTLGLCLGSQLMAQALGGKVYAGHGKEIGWGALQLSEAGKKSPLAHLEGVAVLHWHGDTFTLPPGATLLASSDLYPHQAFAVGDYALALQFHPEVTARGLERWYVGHACEIASAPAVTVPELRADAVRYANVLQDAARQLFSDWLV